MRSTKTDRFASLLKELGACSEARQCRPWHVHGSHIYGQDPDRTLVAQVVTETGALVADRNLIVAAVNSYDASRDLIERMLEALREMFAEAVEYRSQADEEMYNQCDADICGVLTPIGMALPHVPECPFSKGRAAIAAAEKFLKEGQ